MVQQRSVTYVNNTTPLSITTKELDLENCVNDNQVAIKIHSAALNPVDSVISHAANKWLVGSSLKTVGMDYAGVLVKRGKNVDPKFQIGDKVNGFISHAFGDQGSYSDYLIIDPSKQSAIGHMNNFDYLDDDVKARFSDFDINASYPLVFGTAYDGLFSNGQLLNSRSRILVNGASTAVSQCLIQIAKKHLNVETVVGICNSKSFEYNKKAGFDHLIAYDESNCLEKVQSIIKDKFNGQKFDLIFDSVGTSEFFPIIDTILKPRAEGSLYTTVAGSNKLKYTGGLKEYVSVLPLWNYAASWNPRRHYNYTYTMVWPKPAIMELASLMVSKKQFIPPLDSVYPFEEFQTAMDKLNTNQAKGKIILEINKDY
ncbi:hypothetical protein MOUN0_H04192 [Monosporozyma unispora]|nr:zinc ion binding [Kazachstania unispora]